MLKQIWDTKNLSAQFTGKATIILNIQEYNFLVSVKSQQGISIV